MKRNMLKVVAASLAGAMLLTACGGIQQRKPDNRSSR